MFGLCASFVSVELNGDHRGVTKLGRVWPRSAWRKAAVSVCPPTLALMDALIINGLVDGSSISSRADRLPDSCLQVLEMSTRWQAVELYPA